MNVCVTCSEDFASVNAFDAHRIGKYPMKGPSEYTGPLEKWTPSKGRRCLSIPEMQEQGFELNPRGRWVDPTTLRNRPVRGSYSLQDAPVCLQGTPEPISAM